VEAMKAAAFDYLIKPFHLADMNSTLHRACEMLALRVRLRDDVEQARGRYDFGKVNHQERCNPPHAGSGTKGSRVRSHHDPSTR